MLRQLLTAQHPACGQNRIRKEFQVLRSVRFAVTPSDKKGADSGLVVEKKVSWVFGVRTMQSQLTAQASEKTTFFFMK